MAEDLDDVSKNFQSQTMFEWQDVTQEFMSSCEDLQLGELLHDTNFGLFEAMSAIEMMDPKMDAGMMCNQAKRKVLNFEQSIEAGTLKLDGLNLEEHIGIIDDTLACLVTWLEGHSLAQTIFTNLYLHNPYLVEDRTLKAVCICALKTVDLVKDRINRASVFEEEDFQPMTYGFKMVSDVTDMRACGMIKEVEDDLNRTIKNTRSKAGEARDPATEREHELAVGVYSRLKFCRLLLTTLLAFSKDKCQGIADAQKFLVQMLELIPVMRGTVELGIKPNAEEGSMQDCPTIMGFEPLVNQRLLPPTFPRYTKIEKRAETIHYMEELCNRLKTVCSVTDISALHTILEYFHEFSQSSPCVLSRSLLQLVFHPPNTRRMFGQHPMVDVLKETIRNFISPPVLMPKCSIANNPQAKESVDALLQHALRPLGTIFQITGHNRARQRDKWGHLLEELGTLQDEADKVDAFLHSLLIKAEPNRQHLACFGTWVLYHTLQVMIHYTLAGFELELYAVHEYHYIYWYLYECLYNWLTSTLTRADGFILEQDAIADQQQKGRTSKKSKKKKRPRQHLRETTIAQATQSLCGGYYKGILGLTQDGKLKEPKFNFDSEEVRYNHRFAPFGNLVTPPPVQYQQFREMTDSSRYEQQMSSQDNYIHAAKYFQQARSGFENCPNPSEEVNTLLKISKTNFVVMKLLGNGHKKDSEESPEFLFDQHKVFPIIKLL